jgi:hypothetical protein
MDAVFELSMRFAEPFKHDLQTNPNLTDAEMLEAEKLMFRELTQSRSSNVCVRNWLWLIYAM